MGQPIHDIQLLRQRLRYSFTDFVAWHIQWQGYKYADMNKRMATFLEKPSPAKLMLAARGYAKTTIALYYCCWRWLRIPDTRILLISHSDERCADLSYELMTLLRESPVLAPLGPKAGSGKFAWNIALAEIEKDPSFVCGGIKTSRTGRRCDLVLGDDCEVLENSSTASMREKLVQSLAEIPKLLHQPLRHVQKSMSKEQWEQAKQQYANLPEQTQLVLTGTYQTPDSIYLLAGKEGTPLYKVEVEKFSALKEDGTPAFPEKYSMADLEDRRLTDTLQNWGLHYLCSPERIADGTAIVNLDRIEKVELKPRQVVAYLDPNNSGKHKSSKDETAILFGGVENNKLYVMDLQGWHSTDSFLSYRRIVELCKKHDCHVINIECQNPTEASVLRRVISDSGERIIVNDYTSGIFRKEDRVAAAIEIAMNNSCLAMHPKVLLDGRNREQILAVRVGSLPEVNDRVDVLAAFIQDNINRVVVRRKQGQVDSARLVG